MADEKNELIQKFMGKYGDIFDVIVNAVNKMTAENDGDSMVLTRELLLKAAKAIEDLLKQRPVVIKDDDGKVMGIMATEQEIRTLIDSFDGKDGKKEKH
jgi:hypothetical protein